MNSPMENYEPIMKTALDAAKSEGVYAVVRVQDAEGLQMSIQQGNTQGKSRVPTRGMGISVYTKDGLAGFASTSQLNDTDVREAVRTAAKLARDSGNVEGIRRNTEIYDVERFEGVELQDTKYSLDHLPTNEVEEKVRAVNKETTDLDDRVIASTTFIQSEENWRVMRTDGTDATYNMPRGALVNALTIRESEEKISNILYILPSIDMRVVLDEQYLEHNRRKAAKTVDLMSKLLNAGMIEGGHYKSVLSHEFGGLWVHEAVGHPFETDLMRMSIVGDKGRLKKGEKVAPDNISYVDGPLKGIFGNQFISANGVPRQTVEFIRNGVITDALSDIFSANESGVANNGCGRAESYMHPAICRMSATRMVDNNPIPLNKAYEDVTPEDLCKVLVDHKELTPGGKIVMPIEGTGGSVGSKEGKFMFGATGIYMFEFPDKVTLYRQSSFSGRTLGAIGTRARGIGKVLTDGVGRCGKDGQGAPVAFGGNMFFVVDESPAIIFGGEQ